jgi:hypothetical protein
MVSDWWNDPDFNPTTEVVHDLHSDYLVEIDIGYEQVVSMHEATPEYVERRFQGMMVVLKRGIKNWELSGMGDGGRDEDQDCADCEEQYREGHGKFGSISGRDHTALSNRHAFFEWNQSYVLYAWHMLEKHGLLQSSFQMLNGNQSSGDGAGGVPSCIFDIDDGSQGSTEGNRENLSSTASSNKSTSKNKAADTVKGLNNLGDSLKELSKSSERVARIAAESSNVQSLRTNIESLES